MTDSLKNILIASGIPFKDDKILIPDHIKHIKIDIGLSYNAPHSQKWLESEDNLMVFGFEPNPEAVRRMTTPGNKKEHEYHGTPLDIKFLHKSFFVVPVALSNTGNGETLDLYVTANDEGCSSLYQPTQAFVQHFNRPVKNITKVPVFTLSNFLQYLPYDKIDYIEYIKVDAQGADLNIIKGGGDFIKDKVVFITLEPEYLTYIDAQENSPSHISSYMNSIGFLHVQHPNTDDPTFINSKFVHLLNSVYVYQKG
jgi:FkbM family methyltransferase